MAHSLHTPAPGEKTNSKVEKSKASVTIRPHFPGPFVFSRCKNVHFAAVHLPHFTILPPSSPLSPVLIVHHIWVPPVTRTYFKISAKPIVFVLFPHFNLIRHDSFKVSFSSSAKLTN